MHYDAEMKQASFSEIEVLLQGDGVNKF